MDRDTIIRLAREAGLKLFNEGWTSSDNGDAVTEESLERFAALVSAHEREACAKVVDAERDRVLGKQEGESWEPVNINIRMTAVLLPDIAAAIRSRT